MPHDPPPGATESFLRTPGCRLRVWRGGEGRTLVVVSDCGDPLEMWREAFMDLSRDHEVVLLEQPGFGYSEVDANFDYRWQAHFDSLRTAVEQLGLEGAVGLGHCVGGTQLLALDHERPGLLRAAVLAETFPADRYSDLGINMVMHRVARIRGVGELFLRVGGAGGVRSGSRHLLATLGAGRDWVTDEIVERHVGPVVEGHCPTGGLAHIRNWDGGVAKPVESSSPLPAAYLFGAEGRFARHLAERRAYADACGRDSRTLPDAGHFLYIEQPEAFGREVREIIADLVG